MLIGFHDPNRGLISTRSQIYLEEFTALVSCEIIDSQVFKVVQVLSDEKYQLQTGDYIQLEPDVKIVYANGTADLQISEKVFVTDSDEAKIEDVMTECHIFGLFRHLNSREFLLKNPRYAILFEALKTFLE